MRDDIRHLEPNTRYCRWQWALVNQATGEHGTLALVYDRVR
jgi:hypothetical protein